MTEIAEPIKVVTEQPGEQTPQEDPILSLKKKMNAANPEPVKEEPAKAQEPVKEEVKEPVKAEEKTPEPAPVKKANPKKEKLLQDLGIKSAPATEQTTPSKPALPQEWESEFEAMKRDRDEAKLLLEDPLIKLAVAAKKQGKSLVQVVDEIKGVDPDKTSAEELFKIKLDRLGIKDPEEIEKELLVFGEKTKSDQMESVMNIREQLRSEFNERQNQYVNTTDQNSQKTQAVWKESLSAYDAYLKNMVGKTMYGVVITSDHVKSLSGLKVWTQKSETEPATPEELFKANFLYQYGEFAIGEIADNFYAAGMQDKDEVITVTGSAKQISPVANAPMKSDGAMTPEKSVKSITERYNTLTVS